MEKIEIEVKEWYSLESANSGINELIHECEVTGNKILDVASHVTERKGEMVYTFVIKMTWVGNESNPAE